MHDQPPPPTGEALERAMKKTGTPRGTRRWLLERAAIGTAGVATFGALDPAPAALASSDHIGVKTFGTVAVTTEALTVTLLTELLRRVNANSHSVPAPVKAVFEGAYAAEVDHFRFTRAHWRPTTTKFWIPDAFFGGSGNKLSLTSVGHALVAGETLFVNLYLIGVTVFAQAKQDTFARYSAELAGCESEHRVLAETLLNANPPNNVGFEVYKLHSPKGIEHALEGAGVGFGVKTSAPGKFYHLPHPIKPPPLRIKANKPS